MSSCSAGPGSTAAAGGWLAVGPSRADEDAGGSRLLLFTVFVAVRLEPPTNDFSFVLLSGSTSLVSGFLADLVLREEDSFDLSQDEILDSPFGSFDVEDGPVMVVCVVGAGVVLDVTCSVGLGGLVTVIGFIVVDGSDWSSGTAPVEGSSEGSGTATAWSSVPDEVMSGTGGGSSSTTGADSTRVATSSAWSGSVTGGVIVPLSGSVEIALGSTGDGSSDSDTTSGSSADNGSTVGIGSRTGGSVAVVGLSSVV